MKVNPISIPIRFVVSLFFLFSYLCGMVLDWLFDMDISYGITLKDIWNFIMFNEV